MLNKKFDGKSAPEKPQSLNSFAISGNSSAVFS